MEEEFIKLIEDIGFVKETTSLYIYNDYKIHISNHYTHYKVSGCLVRKYSLSINDTWDSNEIYFDLNNTDLLKEYFPSYFRDKKLKELGV